MTTSKPINNQLVWPITNCALDFEDLVQTLDMAQAMVREVDGVVLFCTSGMCRLYGWSREEMLGSSSHELLATEFPKALAEINAELLRDGQWAGELKHRKRDGETIWVASHWALQYDERTNHTTVIEVNNDILELKRVQNELWKQREAFRALADNSPDSIDRLDRELRQIYANPAAAKMMELTSKRIIGRNDRELEAPDPWVSAREERLREVFETGKPVEADESFSTKRGIRFLNTRYVPEHAADGTVVSVLVVSRDITGNKRAEQALRESESRERARAAQLQATIDAVPAAIFIASSPDCLEVTGNRMTYELLRIPSGGNVLSHPKVAKRTKFRIVKNGKEILPESFPLQQAARERRPLQDYEFDLVFEDGARVSMLGNAVPLSSETGMPGGAVGAFIDVTELRTSQRLLQQSRDRQRDLSDRLLTAHDDERRRIARDLHDDLCQKVAILAFEVRNLAVDPSLEPKALQQRLESLHGRVVHVSEEIRDIAYQLHPSIVDDLGLAAALQALCEEFSQFEGTKIRFTRRGLADSVPQEIAACLYRVTQEALRNVSKHARATKIAVSVAVFRDYVRLIIKDSGIGFKRDRLKGGLGILSIEERVMRVNGRISIASEPGSGTQITIRVPLRSGLG